MAVGSSLGLAAVTLGSVMGVGAQLRITRLALSQGWDTSGPSSKVRAIMTLSGGGEVSKKAIKVGDTGKGHGRPSEGLRKEVCQREEAMSGHMHRTTRDIGQEWICSLCEFVEEYYFKMLCLAPNLTIRVKRELLLNYN